LARRRAEALLRVPAKQDLERLVECAGLPVLVGDGLEDECARGFGLGSRVVGAVVGADDDQIRRSLLLSEGPNRILDLMFLVVGRDQRDDQTTVDWAVQTASVKSKGGYRGHLEQSAEHFGPAV
jgi:hypothetical protein